MAQRGVAVGNWGFGVWGEGAALVPTSHQPLQTRKVPGAPPPGDLPNPPLGGGEVGGGGREEHLLPERGLTL